LFSGLCCGVRALADSAYTGPSSLDRPLGLRKIDHQLQKKVARTIIYDLRAATRWQPQLKGLTPMGNSGTMAGGSRMCGRTDTAGGPG
jgi:hypothetical protein